MQVIQSTNLLNDAYFVFEVNGKDMSEQDKSKLEEIKGKSYLFEQEAEQEFKNFVFDFLKEQLIGADVYLILSESFPETIHKIRTHKKLLYNEKTRFGVENVWETEVPLSSHTSLIAALIQLSEENLKESIAKIFSSEFVFGYIISKAAEKQLLKTDFLTQTVLQYMDIDKRRIVKPLALTVDLCTEAAKVFRLLTHGNNAQALDVFSYETK